MNPVRNKLALWLENNPDSWLKQSFKSIAEDADVSSTSVDRYLPELIADRDNILPSEVMKQRERAGLGSPGRSKPDPENIRRVIEENPGAPVRDLAYLAKCAPRKIQQVIKEITEEKQSKENESTFDSNEVEIEKLKARIAELSNGRS